MPRRSPCKRSDNRDPCRAPFWARAAANIARGMPPGVMLERYAALSRAIGAQVILMPNLESSSLAEQVAWFKRLAAERIVPQRIERGNEFWVAMGNDPASLARWPDAPTSMRIMQQYLDAVTVHLYPRLRDVLGDPQAGRTPPTPANAMMRLTAMLARVDAGTEGLLHDLERRLPGKEIWITEWNARGANPAAPPAAH